MAWLFGSDLTQLLSTILIPYIYLGLYNSIACRIFRSKIIRVSIFALFLVKLHVE